MAHIGTAVVLASTFGDGTVDGVPTIYRIDVTDNGDPGAGVDAFPIRTASGYIRSGILRHGNVQVE